MNFHVIIPTCNRPVLLERTLGYIAEAKHPEELKSIYIVENGSGKEAGKICNDFSHRLPLIYRHTHTPGKINALQSTIEILNNGFALFLDDDVRVSKDLFINYIFNIKKHGKNFYYGGPLLVDYEAEPEIWMKKYLPFSAKGWNRSDDSIPFIKTGYFLGANFGAFIDDIIAVGGFTSPLGNSALNKKINNNPMGMEDELQNKLLCLGKKRFYIKDAVVWHYVPIERSSTDWLLERRMKHNIITGFQRMITTSGKINILYLKLNLLFKFIISGILYLISYVAPGKKYKFLLRLPYKHSLGYFIGFSLSGK